MRINRVYAECRLEPEARVSLDAQAGHYVFRVLKLRSGDALVLFNGDGSDYAAELLSNRRDRVELRVTTRLPAVPEPGLRITLVQAVGKGDRMDYSLQKATELGVAAVQPLFCERTEVRLQGERLERRMSHWRRVMISACEQCGRAVIPELFPPVNLDEWLAQAGPVQRLMLDPGAAAPLAALTPGAGGTAIAVGPEGGFSDLELKQIRLAGVTAVSLGPRVLRTETAGPAAMAVLQALHGDMRQGS
jgi:16S rRNA (uracil1498-N3)-methyltransferase